MRSRHLAFLALAGVLVSTVAASEGCSSSTSTGGSSTTSSTGGAGGMTTSSSSSTTSTTTGPSCPDGGMACTSDAMCMTGVSTKCVTASCASECCQVSNASAGATCSDNGGRVCDGNGACVACNQDSDCGTPLVCQALHCDASTHTCSASTLSKGTTCTGPDGGTGEVCDSSGNCVTAHCTDGVRDADETDVDCGGAQCAPCLDAQGCLFGSDCASKICNFPSLDAGTGGTGGGTGGGDDGGTDGGDDGGNDGGTDGGDDAGGDAGQSGGSDGGVQFGACAVPACNDGVQNGNETDLDCGGAAYKEPTGGPDAGPFAACALCANSKSCKVATDCESGFCAGAGDAGTAATCAPCTKDSECQTGNHCNNGGCTPQQQNGTTCTAADQCFSGNCLLGICCGSPSCPTCQACDLPGNMGTCTDLAVNTNGNGCTNSNIQACDGNGNCLSTLGQTCSTGSNCLSGNCVDGVCCSAASCGTCQACNVTGHSGSCFNVPVNTNGNGCTSATTQACDGQGNCKSINGQTCSTGGTCVSGSCADGFCCNTGCVGTCNTCAATPGTCTNVTAGNNNASHPCPGTDVCDGNGGTSGSCVSCITDAQCSSPLPACDTATTNCVECTTGNQSACTGALPACNTTLHLCVQCAADGNCSGSTPLCNTSTNMCVQCTAGNKSACTGSTPVCNTTTGTCVQCTADSNCGGTTPACDTTSGTCVQCTSTNHNACTATQACANNHTCLLKSGQPCPGGSSTCANGICCTGAGAPSASCTAAGCL